MGALIVLGDDLIVQLHYLLRFHYLFELDLGPEAVAMIQLPGAVSARVVREVAALPL